MKKLLMLLGFKYHSFKGAGGNRYRCENCGETLNVPVGMEDMLIVQGCRTTEYNRFNWYLANKKLRERVY